MCTLILGMFVLDLSVLSLLTYYIKAIIDYLLESSHTKWSCFFALKEFDYFIFTKLHKEVLLA